MQNLNLNFYCYCNILLVLGCAGILFFFTYLNNVIEYFIQLAPLEIFFLKPKAINWHLYEFITNKYG